MEEIPGINIVIDDDFITYNDTKIPGMECALTFRKKLAYDFRF